MGTKPATFVYLSVLKTDQLSLLSWASSSSNTAVCSGSFESLSFHNKITASVQKVSWLIKVVSLLKYCSYLCGLHLCTMHDVPSPPEASSSPFGLKRTTLTALVCLARLDRNSTTAFPSPSVSTRHNCSKPKYITKANENYIYIKTCKISPHKLVGINDFNERNPIFNAHITQSIVSWSKSVLVVRRPSIVNIVMVHVHAHVSVVSPSCRLCSHSLWLLCPLQLSPGDEGVHQSRAGSPGCKLVPYCAKQSHTLPPSCWVLHDLKRTKVRKINTMDLNAHVWAQEISYYHLEVRKLRKPRYLHRAEIH